jgi:ABC-2 type transport system permease protein
MINSLKTECRKLLTVRSTYYISGAALLLVSAIAFYLQGYRNAAEYHGGNNLQDSVLNLVPVAAIFAGIAAILIICHEYRYNTISYTLMATNRRIKVMFAKLIVMAVYGVVIASAAVVLIALLLPLGVSMGGGVATWQDFSVWPVLLQSITYTVVSVWMGLLFGFLFRSLVFSIVIYFVLPTTIEPLLHNVVKVSSNYLPDSAQNQIMATQHVQGMYSPLASAGVVGLYLLVGWVVASVLFIKRDAN